ncbi:MAG: acyl-CoA thioesterase [Candidatus Sericytochromatia bacterium]|nr:acyl-CoA thioesterase [Candidatus Tanganyikabacteria bacterium]
MISVRLRVIGVLARWLLAERRRAPVAEDRLELRCWPWDCDILGHMNNARYLSLMDVARWHFTFASGLWRRFRDTRAFPVMVRCEIDFRRSIKPFERFSLVTRPHRAGGRSVVVSQRFLVGDQVAAEALVTLTFIRGGRPAEVSAVLDALPHLAATTPPLSASLNVRNDGETRI